MPWPPKNQHDKKDREQDRAVADSFPASDPPANSGITGPEPVQKPSHERPVDARPTGTPNLGPPRDRNRASVGARRVIPEPVHPAAGVSIGEAAARTRSSSRT